VANSADTKLTKIKIRFAKKVKSFSTKRLETFSTPLIDRFLAEIGTFHYYGVAVVS